MRFIDSIEPAGEQDTVCIQVAAEDSLYVTDDFLVTHNTLNDAFIILDEAQNTSPEQMKMFLTRLGSARRWSSPATSPRSTCPAAPGAGCASSRRSSTGIEDVSFNRLTAHDVVRHRLVGHIVAAYDEYEARGERRRARAGRAPRGPPEHACPSTRERPR